MRLDHLLSKDTWSRNAPYQSTHLTALFGFEGIPLIMTRGNPLDSFGGVAQLGEHLPCKQGVRSSILLVSTKKRAYSSAG